MTNNTTPLRCDGCGQLAPPQHMVRRFQRLEWTTRYRPIHIATLLLGAIAPQNDSEFLYSPAGAWNGEASLLLVAAGLATEGKSAEATLAEFQRGGFFLTHVLECPLETGETSLIQHNVQQLIADRLPTVLTRIRRSLKPKRLALISRDMQPFLSALESGELNCAILLDQGKPFALDSQTAVEATERLRVALTSQVASARQGLG